MVKYSLLKNNNVLYLFLLSFIVLSINSCKSYRYDKFTLSKQNYTGKQLKTGGYYYFKARGKYYRSYFFYNNGVLLECGGGDFTYDEFIKYENNFNREDWDNYNKIYRYKWGLFKVVNDSIFIEKPEPSSGGMSPVYLNSGVILNDTTFILTKAVRKRTNRVIEKNQTYHFKKFSPKPDSTNSFIK